MKVRELLNGSMLMLGIALVLSLGAPAQAQDLCFQRPDGCVSVDTLAHSGITAVRYLPLGLRSESQLTGWKMYAYRANPAIPPQIIEAKWFALVQGEDHALALQDEICGRLIEAGIACNSDFFAGNYRKSNGASFELEMTTQSHTNLTAQGRFTTKGWPCGRGEGEERIDVQVTCEGSYNTSRRLLYLVNATFLFFSDIACSETATRPALDTATSPKECPIDRSYGALEWLPTGSTTLNIRTQGPSRMTATEQQLIFIRR